MFARRRDRRRLDDALAVASPLALAEAMEAHISGRSAQDVRALITSSVKRMEPADRRQLDLYLDPASKDDLLGHRFSAFLRQNPRALAALDPDLLDAILGELGQLPEVERTRRRIPARSAGLAALALAVAVLPLAAQYAHQRGLLQGLNSSTEPPPIAPFVQLLAARPIPEHHALRMHPAHHTPAQKRVIAHRRRHALPKRAIAYAAPHPRHHAVPVHRRTWWRGYVADASRFGARARLTVQGYLRAIVDGNLAAAFAHLGMPPNADTSALAELAIVTRGTRVAILGSKPQARGTEQVQADIVTGRREYYEVFYVVHDGPAVRISDRYYIPVKHGAQVAMRSLVQRTH